MCGYSLTISSRYCFTFASHDMSVRRNAASASSLFIVFIAVSLNRKTGGAVSRFLFLNLSFIFATYPLASSGQLSLASVFGLAGPGTVLGRCRHLFSWALAPRFHPCPSGRSVLCYGLRKITPTCAFRSGMPFPVRTFLSIAAATDRSTNISKSGLQK